MKKLIICLLLSHIGFSQDCENSILDVASTNDNINQYFQIALSLNVEELSFLDNCDSDINYTLFTPGIDVPTSAVTPLIGGTTPMIDLLLHYIYNNPLAPELTLQLACPFAPCAIEGDFFMLDGNSIFLEGGGEISNGFGIINDTVNVLNPGEPLCACNGIIYIIDDLLRPPSIGLEENNHKPILYPNPANNVLNISKISQNGILEIIDINGKIIFSKEINQTTQINTKEYKKGIYIVSYKTIKQKFTQLISIN